MNRDELAAMVLAEVARQCDAIRNRPKPPAWKTWEAIPDDDDREYGPRYSPTWFGDATATEAGRVRLLRTVYRLADAGLLTLVKSEGGRLERVRLTKAGHKAAAPRPHPRRNPGAGRHRCESKVEESSNDLSRDPAPRTEPKRAGLACGANPLSVSQRAAEVQYAVEIGAPGRRLSDAAHHRGANMLRKTEPLRPVRHGMNATRPRTDSARATSGRTAAAFPALRSPAPPPLSSRR